MNVQHCEDIEFQSEDTVLFYFEIGKDDFFKGIFTRQSHK
jgi:hypothetical protein